VYFDHSRRSDERRKGLDRTPPEFFPASVTRARRGNPLTPAESARRGAAPPRRHGEGEGKARADRISQEPQVDIGIGDTGAEVVPSLQLSRRFVRLIRLIPVARGQRLDQRSLDARDVFAHQPFGAPGFAGDDRFINAVMTVVAAAHVTMLEGDDVAARRYRDAMVGPDHLAEHAVA